MPPFIPHPAPLPLGEGIENGIVNLSRLIPSSGKRVCHLDPSYPLGSPLRTRDLSPTLESMAHFLDGMPRLTAGAVAGGSVGRWDHTPRGSAAHVRPT